MPSVMKKKRRTDGCSADGLPAEDALPAAPDCETRPVLESPREEVGEAEEADMAPVDMRLVLVEAAAPAAPLYPAAPPFP